MIKPVYRVQCDGPGKEWLSLPDDYVPGTDLMAGVLVAAPTAERAGNWPDERAAQRAAVGAGWRPTRTTGQWLCPACASPVRPDEEPTTDERCPALNPFSHQCRLTTGHDGLHQSPGEEPTP